MKTRTLCLGGALPLVAAALMGAAPIASSTRNSGDVRPNVSITTLPTTITQNFNTLPVVGSATWTNNSTIVGWYHARTGNGTTIVANDGSSNAGNLYAYGTGTNVERALGSIGSGNAAVMDLFWGILLTNNTGSTITTLDVTYTGEQWRNSAAAAQTVAFSYFTGTGLTGSLTDFQAAGVNVAQLDFTSPITGGVAAALDGNAAANRTVITFSITGLSLANGQDILLRWSDPDHAGADHGLAIDDFSVTASSTGGPSPTPSPTPSASPTPTPSATPAPIRIHDIQGAAHLSPMTGLTVANVPGIVTAKVSNGFYLQDPSPDANDATSEGIFVFTSSAPTVNVGDAVLVGGTVAEFRSGGSSSANLTGTEISAPTVAVQSTGNALPAAIVVGTGGRIPPSTVIEDDAAGSVETSGIFDPAADGIDFYESLEAMRVQINGTVVVGPRSDVGEIPVLSDDGANASVRTTRGGIVVRSTDFNPERIILDDLILTTPVVHVGDHFSGPVVGVMDYSFGNFKLLITQALTAVPGGLTREITAIPTASQLAVATFNVENLDPGDPPAQFAGLASLIVNNLRSPDIIAVEEIQDNNGPTNDAVVDATVTYNTLIAAIQTAGGPTYLFRQINPVDDQDGGEPGGNIRVGFLFRTDRGLAFTDRAGGCSTCATTVANGPSGVELSFSPGRVDPTNTAFNNSRKPLAGEFTFNGQKLFLIANHFNSKGGDDPLFGRFQPPVLSSEVQRTQQAQIVNNFVDSILALNPNAKIVVLGDLNDFHFSTPINTLKGGVLHALIETLPESERYTYEFEGNAQALDHILVSDGLFSGLFDYDVVHVNAEFADQISDHDPQVVRLTLTAPTPTPTPTVSPTATPATPTPTATPTVTPTATVPPTPSPTATASPTASPCFNLMTFLNGAPITINDAGVASPYPSNITVSGVPNSVIKVTVTLAGFNHTFPSDVDVMLVGPGGQKFILVSDVIGGTDAVGINWTFDDMAAAFIGSTGTPASGTFKPTNYTTCQDPFAAPAPAGPYLSPGGIGTPCGTDTLAAFNGVDPNGTWGLYVVDDLGADVGNISGGWMLGLTVSGVGCPSPPPILTPTPTATATASPTASASPTATASQFPITPTPCPATNVIVDGGFENGGIPSSTWEPETSTNFGTPLCDFASCGNGGGASPPRNGLFWAWFGGIAAPETATLGQTVTIAGGSATLHFWMRVGTVTAPFTDVVNVRVDGVIVQSFLEPAVAETNYTERVVNLNAFANGGPHALLFEYIGPTSGTGSFVIDDVSLIAGGACVTPSPTVPPSPSPTATLQPTPSPTATATPTPSDAPSPTPCGSSTTFANAAPITINDAGVASPYPSNITVSGVSGTITKVTATVTGFNHTFPSDVDMLLVSPAGQKFILVSDVIGGTDAVGINWTFDDAAPAFIGSTGTPASGTFKPTNYTTCQDPFAAPAPAGPYLSPGGIGTPCGTDTLFGAVFGSSNGTWSLYVVDDLGADVGTISGGWSLTFTVSGAGCPSPTPSATASPSATATPSASCPPVLTESSTQTITPLNSVSCNNGTGHTDNSYWRAFNLNSFVGSNPYQVSSVSFGIEQATGAGGTQPVTVRLHTSNQPFPTGYPGSLTQIATATVNVPDSASNTIFTVPIAATVPANAILVMEVFTPDGTVAGNLLFIGSNADPESAPSYLSAPGCGITTPTTTAAIGFPNMHIVFNVTGTCEPIPSPTPTVSPTATPSPTTTPSPSPTATIPPPTPSPTATISPTATPSATIVPSPSPTSTPTATPATQCINLSTRMRVETGDRVGIGGFIITGSVDKQVLLRGIGPSLTGFGVPNVLADPVLELHGSSIATIINDNWRDTQEVEIQATGIPPVNDLEAAILVTLSPGTYTAILRGNGATAAERSGAALVEVYDLSQTSDSKLANLSTRAFVSTGSDIVIAGFLLSDGNGTDRIVVRGIGPSLAPVPFPVNGVLADPILELRDSNGTLLVGNNDWQDNPAQAAELIADGLAPSDPLESGIAATLPPGIYTALLAGLNSGTGLGVVEVYDLGP